MQNRRTKILIVDDQPEIVSTLMHCLALRGYLVQGALNSDDALGILEKERADLILLDIMMPGLNGADFARVIKERYPATKVIIITGYPNAAENLKGKNLVEALFIKPVDSKELYATIKALDERIREELKLTVLYFKTRLLMMMQAALKQNYKNN